MAEAAMTPSIKIIPTKIEIDLTSGNTIKTEYSIFLDTDTYSDFVGGGITLLNEEQLSLLVEELKNSITQSIHINLGLEEESLSTNKTNIEEEQDL